MKNKKFSPGDEVVVTRGYPTDITGKGWYNRGDILTLKKCIVTSYWVPYGAPHESAGIFESYFRHLTKLDKALK